MVRGGGRRPTIIDVADRAGVSKSMVSRVYSGRGSVSADTRGKVLTAAAQLGYVRNAMAASMSSTRTNTLGVFVRDASTPFYGRLLVTMSERAAEVGYRVVVATGSGTFDLGDELHALDHLVEMQVEGLLVCSGLLSSSDLVTRAARTPLVVAGRPETAPSVTSVYCDEVHGGRALADHVADLGHQHVTVLQPGAHQSLTMSSRAIAMADRLRERDVAVEAVRDVPITDVQAPMDQLLELGRSTAVMAPNDRDALAVMAALQRRGARIPEDLSVSGYDGAAPLDSPAIGLTTWVQPLREVGRRAVDALLARLDGGAPPAQHQVLHGTLQPGRTVARLP